MAVRHFASSIGSIGIRVISAATVIPRALHNITRDAISEHALKVLYRLKKAGFESYLVGGGVRDLLLGREPKDFDVATDARPEEVRKLFGNCRLIGRRFRLAHVRFGREIVEVATFRGNSEVSARGKSVAANGRILRDNVYGSLEDDAWRRDFSVNSLYYNIRDFSVLDPTGGMADLETGTLRMLGDPAQRYREDPVRILRAIRFAAKLAFRIHPDTETPIATLKGLLEEIPSARLFEEVLKLFHGGAALQSFELLRHYSVFGHLFPQTEASLAEEDDHFPRILVARGLANTDARIAEGKPVTPGFLLAVLLWLPMRAIAQELAGEGMSERQATELAGAKVIAEQARRVAFPRRFGYLARDVWSMQPRLRQRRGKRPFAVIAHPRFRAAYDFLLLRAEAGEDVGELATWWTDFQATHGEVAGGQEAPRPSSTKRRRSRRGRRGERPQRLE